MEIELSERELEVAALIVQGCNNKEIGNVLGISWGTAKNHVHSILIKTGCRSKHQFTAKFTNQFTNHG